MARVMRGEISVEDLQNLPYWPALSSSFQRSLLAKARATAGKPTETFGDTEASRFSTPTIAAPSLAPTPGNVRVNDPNQDTGSPDTTQSEPSLAVSLPNIVVGYNDSNPAGSFCGYANSSTTGSAFTDDGALAGPQFGDNVLAVDRSGTFYFTFLSADGAGNSSIGVSNSTDGGVTFSAAVQASSAANNLTTAQDKEWLVVDATGGPNDGNLYLVWTSFTNIFTNPQAQILCTRSTDGGATWSAPLALSSVGPSLGHQGAILAVAPDGRVYVVWLDRSTGQLLVTRSDDGGATFNNPVTGGGAITTISQIPGTLNGSIRANSFPSIAVAPSGVVHVVYPASVGADNADVFLVRSTDQGQSWSVPIRVNDDTTTTDQWMPSVAVTSDGVVGVMIYDRRNDPSNLNIDVYLAISRDDGVTFQPNTRVTDTSFPPAVNFDPVIAINYMGDYNQMVAVGGSFYMVWGDNRDLVGTRNDPNVYFAAVDTTTVQVHPSSGFAIQGHFGTKGNFEVVAPRQSVRLAHFWRDNDAPNLPWHGPTPFGSNDHYHPVALIQSNFSTAGNGPGNLEVVARTGNRLDHYWRDDVNPFPWHFSVTIPGANGVQGPALIQGHFGTKGNFEVVAARLAGRLAHFWRDNDAPNLPWHGPILFGSTDHYDSAALIQSNFSTAGSGPGNLEVVAHSGNGLDHYWRDDVNPFPWHISVTIPGSTGTAATPTLIQGSFGTRGNFEVVVPLTSGGLAHFWRDNDAPALPWHGPTPFGSNDVYDAVALIQSNFSTAGNGPGNLEVIAHTGHRLDHYWRDDVNPFPWHGPFAIPGATGIG